MIHVGANIYYWGDEEQRRLLLDGIRPWALAARRRGLSQRLWYCPFDARGPHVFILFGTAPEKREALAVLLDAEIRTFLGRSPSQAPLSADELGRRHRECRGKALCPPDREEGLATNNSFALFDHEERGYPLWLSRGMSASREFWRRMDDLTFWSLGRLEAGKRQAAALRWLAAVGRALRGRGLPAEGYWRLHATTLLLPLADRLEQEEAEVLRSLPQAVGEGNQVAFTRIWDEPAGAALGFDVEGLVGVVTDDDGRSTAERFRVLREVNHMALGQLGLPVRLQIPMVLFAWQRSLHR